MKPEYLHNLKIDPLSENTVEDDFSIIYEFYRPKLVVIVNSIYPFSRRCGRNHPRCLYQIMGKVGYITDYLQFYRLYLQYDPKCLFGLSSRQKK